MTELSCYHVNILMVSDKVIMSSKIKLSCYHDNVIVLSLYQFFLKTHETVPFIRLCNLDGFKPLFALNFPLKV
jgi:hypothetical protein